MSRLNKAQQKSRMIYRGMEGRMEERTLKLLFKRNSTFFSMFLTLFLAGGGLQEPPPLRFFEDSVKTAARSAAKFGDFIRTFIAHLFVFEILNLLK